MVSEDSLRTPDIPAYLIGESEKTCAHCGEKDNLHEYKGDYLCDQHLQLRMVKS